MKDESWSDKKTIEKVLKKVIINPREYFWCHSCLVQAKKLTADYNERLGKAIKLTLKEERRKLLGEKLT